MADHLFISYSTADAPEFSRSLADNLADGPPSFPVWLDKRKLRPGDDWGDQLAEAIQTCKALIYVMSRDSVSPASVCKQEWTRALKYKKPIIPLLLHREAEMPFRLEPREHIDFSRANDYESALARLRKHLLWLDSAEGRHESLKHRLEDAKRDLARADEDQQARIKDDIAELERQVAQQRAVIDDPQAARQRVQQTIDLGLERVRKPAIPLNAASQTKFINQPPLIAPTWFQDRDLETKLIGDFLNDDGLRLMTIVGRGGIGKSAITCRLLRSLQTGQLPNDRGPLAVDGIVYLSDARSFHRVNVPDLFAGLMQLLPEEAQRRLDSVYKNPQTGARQTTQALVEAFPRGRVVILLDNFEDEVDVETGRMKNAELQETLRALLEFPPHALKIIVTTRIAPRELALVEPARQRRLDLDQGLEPPFAENILRAMDADGKIGLRDAPQELLAEARERTSGHPRALEHLFGILSADRDTKLKDILENTKALLPENVVLALVGEAFSRLDVTAQRVMQALAIYRFPVSPAALDYLLHAHVPGIDSAPVLGRLVNMQFARRDEGRYYLHQIDRDYAQTRIPAGEPADREAEPPPFTCFALQHSAAEWFKLARKPREAWKTLEDLAAQLAEFELRYAGEDFDTAAVILRDIDAECLNIWGHYHLSIEMHERLQGKVSEPALRQSIAGVLGNGYFRVGASQRALDFYELALGLAREMEDREGEGNWLGSIGNAYAELGQNASAMKYYEEALALGRDMGDRRREAFCLGGLSDCFASCGQTLKAIEYRKQALTLDEEHGSPADQALDLCNLGERYATLDRIDEALESLNKSLKISREIGYRLIEAGSQAFLGQIYLSQYRIADAARAFEKAVEIADDTASTQLQHLGRQGLAEVRLRERDWAAARKSAEEAQQFDFLLDNHRTAVVLGIACLRLNDGKAAREAFVSALERASQLLAGSPEEYAALDTKGLALCGLGLCEKPSHLVSARQAFESARALTAAPGVIIRVLRLFETLAEGDSEGVLAAIRPYAQAARTAFS